MQVYSLNVVHKDGYWLIGQNAVEKFHVSLNFYTSHISVAASRYEVDVSAVVLWLSQPHWYADWVTTGQVWPCHKWAVRVSAHHTFVSLSHCHTVTLPCNIGLTEALRSSQEIISHPNKCNMDTIQAVSVYMVFPSVRQVPGLLINLFGNVSLVWGSHWHTGAQPRPTSPSCWSSENEKNESLEIIPSCLHSTWSDRAWSV